MKLRKITRLSLCTIALLVFATACGRSIHQIDDSLMPGIASPIRLQPTETVINLNDYLLPPALPTLVEADGYECVLDTTARLLTIREKADQKRPPLSELKLYFKKTHASILMIRSEKQKIVLRIPDKAYKTFQVKGEFNAWTPTNCRLENGNWHYETWVNPGQYQYCVVINGKDQVDPSNSAQVDNGMGSINSVVKVGQENTKETPFLVTVSANNRIEIATEGEADEYFVFWENYRLDDKFIQVKPDTKNLVITIPSNATSKDRSAIRIYAYNAGGTSNDLYIQLDKGSVLTDAKQLKRTDFHRNILYSLMIDRFSNGDTNNDRPLNRPDVLPKADYMGGDLAGIIQKIETGFFDSLGINTIWVSPITQNPEDAWGQYLTPKTKFSGYHGYWPIYMTVVDHRFGTAQTLKTLLDKAHAHNLNVILDYAANHVHINSPFYAQHPDWCTPMYLPDGTRNLERWDDHRLTTWFDTHLPKFDFEKPIVSDVLSDSLLFWVEKFDFDGYRHDASKHIHDRFWRTATLKMKQRVDRPLYQIGETYGSPELISSYVNSGMLSGQFDFNVYDALIATLLNGSFKNLNTTLMQSLKTYGYHNLMGYITGNHDRGRFISYAGGALKPGEDAKLAGWTREIGVGDPIAYKKLQLLQTFVMSIPGVPCVYQGDEFGQPGGNDPDNRRLMQFGNYSTFEQGTLKNMETLTHLRTSNLALIYGDYLPLVVEDDVLVFVRIYFDNLVVIGLNKGQSEFNTEIKWPKALQTVKAKEPLKITIPAMESRIIVLR